MIRKQLLKSQRAIPGFCKPEGHKTSSIIKPLLTQAKLVIDPGVMLEAAQLSFSYKGFLKRKKQVSQIKLFGILGQQLTLCHFSVLVEAYSKKWTSGQVAFSFCLEKKLYMHTKLGCLNILILINSYFYSIFIIQQCHF